ncbi:MAG: trypsin-like peptidase domain-containing protein [Pirellulales bacterium]|nr:trypsin-like peptidase domain-containing protein [Pirellulales bacterium]
MQPPAEFPETASVPSSTPAHRPAPHEPGRLTRLLVLLVILAIALGSPTFVERIQYALTRGQLLARSDLARETLVGYSGTSEAFRLASESIAPSVVDVMTVQEIEPERGTIDEWSSLSIPREVDGQGSGVIVDDAGYILTNYHVIARSSRVDVKLSDGRTVQNVQIVGVDPPTDLAVLKIEARALTAAPWGKSEDLEVGDWVVAIGSPYGLQRSVTAGIVSAKRRRNVGIGGYQEFLQTDAAVNPGNSGGPLVDLRGQVVGINTAILGQSFQGISFAIPSELARDIYERLRAEGKVARGWLGVQPRALTPELAEKLGLEATTGAVVVDVVPGAPADKIGIEPGDVIVRWNDQPVHDPAELRSLIAATAIGSQATIEVIRDGERKTMELEVIARPSTLETER